MKKKTSNKHVMTYNAMATLSQHGTYLPLPQKMQKKQQMRRVPAMNVRWIQKIYKLTLIPLSDHLMQQKVITTYICIS